VNLSHSSCDFVPLRPSVNGVAFEAAKYAAIFLGECAMETAFGE